MPFLASAVLMLLATPPTPLEEPAKAETAVKAEAEAAEEGVICRRKMVPHPQIMNRMKSVRVCKTKEDWARAKPRR